METLITYQQYKRYTSQLLQWLTQKCNSILVNNQQERSVSINRTGRVHTADLVPMARLVARYVTVPTRVHKILLSTIELRSARYREFKRLERTCPWLASSNESHHHFIEVLRSMFGALGGPAWQEQQTTIEPEVIANRFTGLHVDSGESGDESACAAPKPTFRKTVRHKRKGGKKIRRRKPAPSLPLESYQIVQDDESLKTEYLIAAYELVQEFRGLRKYVQAQWRSVAYDGLNSAVAGSLSHMVIAGIQQSELDIWLDFPDGYDTFESVIRSVTCGNMERAHSMFGDTEKDDFKEYTMYYTYQDLLAFVKDFQEKRNGQPTKRMAKELRDWDPFKNLVTASKEERLAWRRQYTILWLYSLVNTYTCGRGKKCPTCDRCEENLEAPKEDGNWRDVGIWRRLYGMNKFAGFVSWLAMQRPGTDVTKSIQPHHVFELQCAVDSWCIARGWSPSEDAGKQLLPPAQWFQFLPERDLFSFLGTPDTPCSFQFGLKLATDVVQNEPQSYVNDAFFTVSERLRIDLIQCLGFVAVDDRLAFKSDFTHENGLWSYCPYLCGVGLSEALELAQKIGLSMLEIVHEVMLIVHVYNACVRKGYMPRLPGHFCEQLMRVLGPESFFVDGVVPTAKFAEAFFQQTQVNLPFAKRKRNPKCITCSVRNQLNADYNALQRYQTRKGDILQCPKVNANKYFRQDSFLVKCYNADWNVRKISDEVLQTESALFRLRKNSSASESTDSTASSEDAPATQLPPMEHRSGLKPMNGAPSTSADASATAAKIRSKELMFNALKDDLQSDIEGARPLSGLNYWLVVTAVLRFFQRFEKKLAKSKESKSVNLCLEPEYSHKENRRLDFVLEGLADRDEPLLRAFALELQNDPNLIHGLRPYLYWYSS